MPVQCYDGYQYDQTDSRATDNPKSPSYPNIRTQAGFSVVPTKWLTEFGAACDTLCRRLGTLGVGSGATGCGTGDTTVPSGGLGGPGLGAQLHVLRTAESVGPELPSGDAVTSAIAQGRLPGRFPRE